MRCEYRFRDPAGVTHRAWTFWSVMADCGAVIARNVVPGDGARAWTETHGQATCLACIAEDDDES